jgi:TonB-linked SusC/RagA family outer membrane protein
MKKRHCIPYASPGIEKKIWSILKFSLLLAFIFTINVTAVNASGQISTQSKITGTVTDGNNGEPLPGVYVIIEGTTTGTMTDGNGNYSITVPDPNSVLVFSYLGYITQKTVAGGSKVIDIKLISDVKSLDAVVVVGYGTQKKASLVGSVSEVKSEEIVSAPMANISQAIVGKLPGLIARQSSGQPGSDGADLYIRGFGTLNGNSPIILVDGIERSMNSLDPNEIESVTILKDAAAAAVYGVRGANGVVLVTTKRGMEGKPTVTYSSSYSLSTNTRMPKYLNGEEFVKWYNYADQINGRANTFSDEVVDKVTNGDPEGIYGNTNWVDEMLKPASMWHNNVSVNGGANNVNYFVSLGNLNQPGIINRVDYNRSNFRSNIDAKINNQFSVELNLSGNSANSKSPQIANFTGNGNSVSTNLMNQIIIAQPYLNPLSPDGKPLVSSLMTGNNPVAARDKSGFYNTDNTGLQASLSLKYDARFIKGLSFKFTGSYDKNYYHSKSYYTPYSLYMVDINSASSSLTKLNSPYGSEVQLSEYYTQTSRKTAQEFVTYKNTFGKNNFDFLFVAEQSEYSATGLGASIQNFDLSDLAEFTYGKNVIENPSGYSTITRRLGFVDRINYTYDNRYLVEVSSRVDASTNFPKDKRYGFFPSVSAGWRISEEDFFKALNTPITNLKLRGSFGMLGNDVTNGTYEYMRFMVMSSSPVANFGGANANGLYTTATPNYDLTWEKSRTTNGGFEMELWDGKLGVEFDYFYKVTNNILTTVSGTYPPSIGGNYPSTVNSGKVDNRGLELVLSHRNKIGYFDYTVRGNVSWAHNRILKMDQSADIPEYLSLIGRSMGVKTGLISEGLFQSDEEAATSPTVSSGARAGDIKYKDINGDGKITYEQDVTIIGRSSMPELNFGFSFESTWKSFDFSFLFQGAALCDNALMGWYEGIGWDDTQYTRTFYNYGNSPKYLLEGSWTPENTDGKYPRLDNQWRPNNNWASTLWIKNGAYLRLKNAQFGYSLPGTITDRIKAKVKVYIATTNLFTISSFKYLDPEAPNVSNGYYPQQKTFSMGATVTF